MPEAPPASQSQATGAPVACGALGSFDRARVLDCAEALRRDMRIVHEDERSILFCDREPIRWRGADGIGGLAWVEGEPWRDGVASWEDAAIRGACGLAIEGRRRLVHSSVSGLARLYWLDEGGATYFASRIDPLVTSSPGALSVDWDAWASTMILRYPLRERTPFAEIRRLGPYSTIRRRLGRNRVEHPSWPWAEVEPGLGLDEGADAWVAALREMLDPLPRQLICPLSGGRDSRIVICGVPPGRDLTALTVDDDEGARFEEDRAEPVVRALGVKHEELRGTAEDYPADWDTRARAVEYQFVDHPWLVPLAERIDGVAVPVLDGGVIDITFQAGERFYTAAALDTSRPREASAALWETLRRFGHAQLALVDRFRDPLVERAREQFMAEMRRFEGHPSQGILGVYWTRTVRGTSSYPNGLLGDRARMIVPGASHALASIALAIPSEAKRGAHLYSAVLGRLAPQVAHLPSTTGSDRSPPTLPRRWCSEPALAAYRELVATGPLAGRVAPELRAWLETPAPGELGGHLRMGLESVALLHAWWQRYSDRLREVDAAELFG